MYKIKYNYMLIYQEATKPESKEQKVATDYIIMRNFKASKLKHLLARSKYLFQFLITKILIAHKQKYVSSET